MLSIYMLGVREVALDVCLAQLFFIHTFSIMESSAFGARAGAGKPLSEPL